MRCQTSLLASVLLSFLMAACASAPVIVEEAPPPPVEPASPLDGYRAIVADQERIEVRGASPTPQSFSAAGPTGFVSGAPDGSAVVLSKGGSLVAVSSEDGVITLLSEGSEDRVYTGAWSTDGMRFHFGYFVSAADGTGAGGSETGIDTWDRRADEVRSVGCSASKIVLAEVPGGSLMVRNEESLYEVEAIGCETIRSVDARKLHHVSASPDGRHLAYILRELVYNRERRAYEPDSTLYIESTTGSDPIKVIGDRYAPRNLSWRPDGSELLYDVAPPDDGLQRAVSVYTVADGRSTYVIPPAASSAVTHPSMAPGGRHIVYQRTSTDGGMDWQVKTSGATFSQSLPMPEVPVTGMYWVDADTLIVATEETSYLLSLAAATPILTDLENQVVWLWPQN